jgi:two-component system chemotaxis sensor kinase CheA
MHTIKGSAAMMMYQNITKLAHSMEDIFFYLREEEPKRIEYSVLSDLVLEGIDYIKSSIEKIGKGESIREEESELSGRLQEFLVELKNSNHLTEVTKEIDDTEDSSTENQQEEMGLYKAVLHFEEGSGMENIRAFQVIHKLEELVKEVRYYPEQLLIDNNALESIISEGFLIYLRTELSYDIIYHFFQQTIFLKELMLVRLEDNNLQSVMNMEDAAKDSTVTSDLKEQEISQKVKEINSSSRDNSTSLQQSFISVSVSKLDKLLDMVGEMVITEAMVINNPDLKGLDLINFRKSARQLNKITNEIKDMVMSIRMVPLSATFHKMHRVVRDMCKKLNKEVQLKIVGEETEVDKNIIEHLSDPLMHLIRNAVDHGIETMEDRILAGKSKTGTVTLEAKNIGGDVLIIIKDDGKGLDKEKILKKTRESHLLSTNTDNLVDKDIFRLILQPGFSTKDDITEFSGRGVGMDVVASNIEAVSGSISIDSIQERGTTITIKIPLTLAIIDAMHIRVGSSYYSIPTTFIQESFRLKADQIITDLDGNEMLMIRGRCSPVIRLHNLYNLATNISELTQGIMIMIQQEDRSICLFADELIGQQQIVVKSLPKYLESLKNIKGITGCTLLGDGSISLILDAMIL